MYKGKDRTEQVNAINELASDLDSCNDSSATADEVVDWYLSSVGKLPKWWDDHDTNLLKSEVKRLRGEE